jgi:hypothetical protein
MQIQLLENFSEGQAGGGGSRPAGAGDGNNRMFG